MSGSPQTTGPRVWRPPIRILSVVLLHSVCPIVSTIESLSFWILSVFHPSVLPFSKKSFTLVGLRTSSTSVYPHDVLLTSRSVILQILLHPRYDEVVRARSPWGSVHLQPTTTEGLLSEGSLMKVGFQIPLMRGKGLRRV